MIKYVCPNCDSGKDIVKFGALLTIDYGHFGVNGEWVENNPINIVWECYQPIFGFYCLSCGTDFVFVKEIKGETNVLLPK